jgi:hypothetical protein
MLNLELQKRILDLMKISSCFGREVCVSPPCACAQSLIDRISALLDAHGHQGRRGQNADTGGPDQSAARSERREGDPRTEGNGS